MGMLTYAWNEAFSALVVPLNDNNNNINNNKRIK